MNNPNNGQMQTSTTSYSNTVTSNSADMLNSYDATSNQAQPSAQQPQAMQNQAPAQANTQQNMQAKAVVGIFADLTAAEEAVTQLRGSGFTTEEINIVSKDPGHTMTNASGNDSVMDGTMTGGAIGGIGGLLLSAGALTIPGLGPIMAAGPIAATIAGAIGGGITGGLIDWGIPSDKSEEYSNEVSSGNTLAVIKAPQNKVAQVVQILTENGANNVETHNAK